MSYKQLLSDYLDGTCFNAYTYFGAHPETRDQVAGWVFRVWAPHATKVQVAGEMNGWNGDMAEMERITPYGVYEYFSPDTWNGMMYRYRIFQQDGQVTFRSDPYAFRSQLRPENASVTCDITNYRFRDEDWISRRRLGHDDPLNIYEIHLGSWQMKPHTDKNRPDQGWHTYTEIAHNLIAYLKENHYTHVEFMPLAEHPFDGSWGYMISGFFSVTSRYGTPQQLMELIDELHRNNIGVIMDYVPIHFVPDGFALANFDGTRLYEYTASDIAYSQWGSCNFDFEKNEVRSFLQSAANFWVDLFHVDGLRVDAVSNAIYWMGNSDRGVNMGGMTFIRGLNVGIHQRHPGVMMIAEDSSSYPKVTARAQYDGLEFDYKWDLGWMNDTLKYFAIAPYDRKDHHNMLTFSMYYFYSELFLLPFSHDEVVHGKKTIVDKIFGTYEEKFAQARLLYAYMYTHPGKKLNFMGNDLGQLREWDEHQECDWMLLSYPQHDAFHRYMQRLNEIYTTSKPLYIGEYNSECFRWTEADNLDDGTYSYIRMNGNEVIGFVMNTYGMDQPEYRFALPFPVKDIKEILSSDEDVYGGSGVVNRDPIVCTDTPHNGMDYSFTVHVPPFGAHIFTMTRVPEKKKPARKKAATKTTAKTTTAKKRTIKKAPAKKTSSKQ